MTDDDTTGVTWTSEPHAIGMNTSNTVGIRMFDFTTNQTRSTIFTPRFLREWAEFVEDVYGEDGAVEVVFTPDCSMMARPVTDDPLDESIGVAVAPRIKTNGGDDE